MAVLSTGMVGSLWLYGEYSKFGYEIKHLKREYLASQQQEIKEEVDRTIAFIEYQRKSTENQLKHNIRDRVYEAVALAEHLHQTYQDLKSGEEIQLLIREALRSLQFNQGRGYFFIYDMEGNNILLPFSPHLEGTNLWNLQDSRGSYNVQRITAMVKSQGEGFLRWYWYKPGNKKQMAEKIGFSKYFEPYGWWIGTGEYVEDVEKDIQQQTLDRINAIRFGDDGYIFVYDFDATTLAHFKQKNIGINRWDFKDANGIYVLRELITMSQQKEGGFLSYVGTIRPSTGLPAPKIGYARSVDDWRWMVGAGVYVDAIDEILETRRAALISKIKAHLVTIFAFLAISLLVIILISRYITRKITNNMETFSRFFEQAASDSITIRDQSLHFSEFKRLARSANQMIDERNRASTSLEKLQDQLNRSKKMEALGVLAGGVAHDLNNVLSAMVGYPDLILEDLPENSPLRRYILTIKDSGQKAAVIVQDLLTLARRGVAQRVILDVNGLVGNYLNSPEHAQILIEHPEVEVKTELDPELLTINGSRVHLQKTLMNLIANAAEAQPTGGMIRITTENRYIDQPIGGHPEVPEGEYVLISVEDQGVGIDTADLEHIFEPFFSKKQLGKSGTGLGMAVVWGTIQDHDGYINVATSKGQGTLFELYFPASREQSLRGESAEDIAQYRGQGESILVVDDLKVQRELAQDLLCRLGYTTETAPSGEATLEYLKHHEVDLVILDMIMDPGIDGLETFRRILEIHPQQKAIIASGYAETDRIKEARGLGVAQYLKKPYTINAIGKAVKQGLRPL
ncbi:cache domain-containing protein [Desulfogranum mediterraneum]|uniref:cache domain-containing protein n=1 Tax=Desulfogranum mediterraneum TaxID=160661 RepID=UPI000410F5DA|nr:cache domain-containing protein [Desulfogranum mediterraneum]